ncbi:MAG: hypothetical protein RL318_2670 [Fibrobacterota bacterium]|jgi:hypothetical protein
MFFSLLAVMLLGACASEDMAGRGVAGETTNGIRLRGVLKTADGSALAKAPVHLKHPLDGLILSNAVTDSSGRYELVAPKAGRYVVVTSKDSLGVSRWVDAGGGETTVPDMAAVPLTVLKVGLQGGNSGLADLQVSLPALGLTGTVLSDSTWSVAGVPAGWHLVRISDALGTVGEGVISTWNPDAVRISRMPRTLLDDFEADQGQGRLVHLLDGAWWGRWNDTSALVDSARTWAGTVGLATDSSAWQGKSLHLPMRVGRPLAANLTMERSAGAVLKVGGREDLDSASVWHGLAMVDSVVFWAKGTGSISFELKCRGSLDRAVSGSFRATIVLNADWTRVALAPGDFTAPSGLSWKAASVRELYWIASQDSELWLDEIELVGVRPTGLWVR